MLETPPGDEDHLRQDGPGRRQPAAVHAGVLLDSGDAQVPAGGLPTFSQLPERLLGLLPAVRRLGGADLLLSESQSTARVAVFYPTTTAMCEWRGSVGDW